MYLARKVLAFFGWLVDGLMNMRSFAWLDHASPYHRSLLVVPCGLFYLGAGGCAYTLATVATTTYSPATLAQVAARTEPAHVGGHVVISGQLQPVEVSFSCDEWGSNCRVLRALSDGASNVVWFVGPLPSGNQDVSVTVEGSVGVVTSESPVGRAMAQARGQVEASTSSTFIDSEGLGGEPLYVVLGLLLAAIGSLLALSYRIGIVPFGPSASVPMGGTVAEGRAGIPCGVTGTLTQHLFRWQYRDRSARLSMDRTGLMLSLTQWWPRHPRHPRTYVPGTVCFLEPHDLVGTVEKGMAYLVLSTRPAIRLATRDGRVVLTFHNEADRDAVLARIAAWPQGC